MLSEETFLPSNEHQILLPQYFEDFLVLQLFDLKVSVIRFVRVRIGVSVRVRVSVSVSISVRGRI